MQSKIPVCWVWTADEISRLGAICRQHRVLVVSVDTHHDITCPRDIYTLFVKVSPADAANSIISLSHAKSFNIPACCSAFTVVPNEARRKACQAANGRVTVNEYNALASVAMQATFAEGALSPNDDRMVDAMAELVRFALPTRDVAPYLVDPYSKRKETGEAFMARVNRTATKRIGILFVF